MSSYRFVAVSVIRAFEWCRVAIPVGMDLDF